MIQPSAARDTDRGLTAKHNDLPDLTRPASSGPTGPGLAQNMTGTVSTAEGEPVPGKKLGNGSSSSGFSQDAKALGRGIKDAISNKTSNRGSPNSQSPTSSRG